MSKDKEREEELSLDLKTIKRFFSNKALMKKFSVIVLLIIPIMFSIYLRAEPAYMPITDKWAQDSVYNNIKSTIKSQIDTQYPNLPATNKNQIVNDQFAQILKTGKINIGGQDVDIATVISQNSEYFKERFQNEFGHTYLLAIDPYYYYRLTRNLIDHGYEGDYQDPDGLYHDTKILAGQPLSAGTSKKIVHLHVLIQFVMYKIASLFNQDVDLMHVIFFTPLIFGTLAVIPAFFITRKIAGNFGGFIAGVLIAIHPAFLSRTIGGFSDTDAYNVFFPLLIIWLILEALDSKSISMTIILAGLSALAVGLFSFTWSAWYFIFDFAIVMLICIFAFHLVMNRKSIIKEPRKIFSNDRLKNAFTVGLAFFLLSAVFVTYFKSFTTFTNFFGGTIGFTQLKEVGIQKIWPNVYTTVAELNPASLNSTISQISLGSKIWYFIALIGLVIPLVDFKSERKENTYFLAGGAVWYLFMIIIQNSIHSQLFYAVLISLPIAAWIIYSLINGTRLDIRYSLILAIWFASTIYAGSKGVRFILLLVPAFAIASGITAGVISRVVSEWVSKELNMNRVYAYVAIFGIFCALLFFPINFVKAANDTALNEIPSMDDSWFSSLTKIRDQSKPDAIINSWWDFGHWFAAIGQRAVTLDGGRQNNPAAHWLGKLMLTWNETESVGILRYLDCGSNSGFDKLLPFLDNDSYETINTIYDIIVLDRTAAKEILLSKGLTDAQAEDVLQYTHCSPPEDYFITSEDMVGKSGVWAHFGAWDFDKALMYNKVYNKNQKGGVTILEDEFGLNSTAALSTYNEIKNTDPDQWISPWPSYAGDLSQCTVSADIVSCSNGIQFDLSTEEASIPGTSLNVKAVSYIDRNGNFRIKQYPGSYITSQNGRPLGAAIVQTGGSYQSVLMDYDLTGSMFTRLFYFGGVGLSHFDMFNNVRDITGAKIITWKVDWQGRNASISVNSDTSTISKVEQSPSLNTTPGQPSGTPNSTVETALDSGDASLAKVEHILISTSNRTDADALALADKIYSMITPDNFDTLAQEYSECSDETIRCSPGWFGRGVMPKSFEDAVFSLEAGGVSKPFKTSYGYEIVKLLETK